MSDAVKSVRILEDIEEAVAREIRSITFMSKRTRSELVFQEMFNPLTGEAVRKPVEAQFFDDTAAPGQIVSPRFTVSLLKIYEDTQTHRLLPPYGNEDTELVPSAKAYEVVTGGNDAIVLNGTGDALLTNNIRIKRISSDHIIRLIDCNNSGTYLIESMTLTGNGPHTITLSNTLLADLPIFSYNKQAGLITFNTFIDISTVIAGDTFTDRSNNPFPILAVDSKTCSIAVTPGSTVINGIGASVVRTSPVLSHVETSPISYLVLDPSKPVVGKSTNYRERSWPIPYTFLYYIKISSNERDDHIAVADRMMQIFNPPRGQIFTIVRTDQSTESSAIKDVEANSSTIFVEDASSFYVNDVIRLFSDVDLGEELTILNVNNASNSITVSTPVAKTYLYNNNAKIVSNTELRTFERDFKNHMVDDIPERQFWVHRFTFKIEAWVDSRIPEYETEQTFDEIGNVNYISGTLEGIDDNV
jgi:hypothetical protein